jgi:two-component system LytT family response regulator
MMERVRRHWRGIVVAASEPLPPRAREGGWLERLSVHVGEHIRVIATGDIDWISANGNYVHIHSGKTTYVHRETLQQLLRMLDPAAFMRVHRGVIVNVARVREVHPLFNGNAELVLHDGTRVGLSRRFRAQASRALGLP